MKKSRFDRMAELLDSTLASHFDPGQKFEALGDHPAWADFWADFENALRAELGGKHISIPGPTKATAAARNERIIRDRKNGVSISVLTDKYGLSRAAVYKILKKMGLSRPK